MKKPKVQSQSEAKGADEVRTLIYPKSNGAFACLHCGAPVTSGGHETFADRMHECLEDCTNVPCAKASTAIETPSSTTYSPLSIPAWESDLLESLPPGSTVDGKGIKCFAPGATQPNHSMKISYDVSTNENKDVKYNTISNPRHYTQGIECWDYIKSHNMDYLSGNIVKYVTRYKYKNGLEDLKKAKAYLDKLIEGYEILERYK